MTPWTGVAGSIGAARLTDPEADLTDQVLRAFADSPEPRTRQVLEALVRHLHAFLLETEPTEAEWLRGIEFLTAVGQASGADRQEFILLSDVLGASSLVEALNHRQEAGGTESTILGPFYLPDAPRRKAGAAIGRPEDGEPAIITGVVRGDGGVRLRGALVDVWQANASGLYDVQDPTAPRHNLRGRFLTDRDGRYSFRGVRPVAYPVPTDGPVGELLREAGRQPWRTAHIHFRVSAAGHRPLVTHLFDADDPRVATDAVFAVKASLLRRFVAGPDGVYRADFDITLEPAP